MRGVCLDSNNPTGMPSPQKLHNLGATGFRMELRATPAFDNYYHKLRGLNSALLIGPQTEPLPIKLDHEPDIVIIGNEPDMDGDSSWTMTPSEYVSLWKRTAPWFPNSALCVAGMFHDSTTYLDRVLGWLTPSPTYVNKHYPNSERALQDFTERGSLIIGEWTYYTGTTQEIVDWQQVLSKYTAHSFWFCWSDGMVPEHGLVTAEQRKLSTYFSYKEAIK